MTTIEPHISLAFGMHAIRGGHAALLGAGMSAAAGIPAAWEVQQDLLGKLAAAHGETPQDPFAWYRERYLDEASYDTLLGALAHTPEARQQLLRGYFEPAADEEGRRPTPAHHALARLAQEGHVRVILTTNFDRLMEAALRAAGIEPVVVSSPADLAGLSPLHTLGCVVVHLHGDYLRADTLLNTPSELAAYPDSVNAFLDRVFDEYGLIVLGWSANYDVALRDAWSRCPTRRFASYWVDPRPLGEVATELAARRAVTVVTSTADEFLTNVSEAVASIADTHRQHPATTAAAVGVVKRLLATEATPIRAHDLLRVELAKIETTEAVRATSWDTLRADAEYQRRLEVLLNDIDAAASLIATLAYWGNPSTDTWWLRDLETLAVHPRVGGSTTLIKLAMAPATLLFYAAGTAAAAAQRWDLVAVLLTQLHGAEIYSGEPANIPDLIDPDHTLGITGTRTVRALLDRVASDHLGLTASAAQDAWERFAYLDLVSAELRGKRKYGAVNHIRVTDTNRREFTPVPAAWFRRVLASPAAHPLHTLGGHEAILEAAARVDSTLHDYADKLAWSTATDGEIPSGMWLPADRT